MSLPDFLPFFEAARLPEGRRLQLFTDGSCRHPTVPVASHAGFSVVRDASQGPDEISASLLQWRQGRSVPGSFRLLVWGLFLGAGLRSPPTDIYTDSAFAMAEWGRLERSEPCFFPDLARALVCSWRRCYVLHKVKVYQDTADVTEAALWSVSGNHVGGQGRKTRCCVRLGSCWTSTIL